MDASQLWVQTLSGKRVFLLSPRSEDIDPRDIAHGLSILPMWQQAPVFFSAAQYAVLVSHVIDCRYRLFGLLAASPHAYLGFSPAMIPLWNELAPARSNRSRVAFSSLGFLIASRFGLRVDNAMVSAWEAVNTRVVQSVLERSYDHLLLAGHPTRYAVTLPEGLPLDPLPARQAAHLWMRRFAVLTGEVHKLPYPDEEESVVGAIGARDLEHRHI